MAGINNNLYPPIFNKSYMPAFVKQNGCRVYFSISSYNSLSEMHHPSSNSATQVDAVQVTVQNQKTNQSVLSTQNYPSGIKLTNLKIDPDREGNDIYYIEIFNSDIQGGFNLNQYYKVQIRFTSAQALNPPLQSKGIDKWLSENLEKFSEWSTVVLIRPISNPILILNSFSQESDSHVFSLNDITIAGRVRFSNEDQQTLQKYRIHIYDENENLLQDSGDIYPSAYSNGNQINYRCKYDFKDHMQYILGIQILTQNLYSWESEKKFPFEMDILTYTVFQADISAKADNEAGRIGVRLYQDTLFSLRTNIVIRRSSSKNNFTTWEDMHIVSVPANSILNYTWYDYTIENGVWYLYRAQQRNRQGFVSTNIEIPQPVMMISEDIFLTTAEKQLKIRFDPQVTNYSHSVSQSLTETIGSKYPFIRRNGNVNYRTFTLSGTITHFMDIRENLMHSSKQDLYSNSLSLYDRYNSKNNITLFNDVIYERDFREQVIKFLYENNVKLYKSATEGNILVKLMNISFTPNTTLGRQIYSFTCTAYEIDNFSYENCIKYNIQDQGMYQYSTNYLFSALSQINRPSKDVYYLESGEDYPNRKYANLQYFGNGELIHTDLLHKCKKWTTDLLDVSINYLSYLKIELTSKPYLIGINADKQPYKIEGNQNGTEAVYLGHIAIINNIYIIIGKDGIYELSDQGTQINSLRFISPTETGTISYKIEISEKEKDLATPKDYSKTSRVGQFWGFFNIEESIYRKILNRYNQSYNMSTKTSEGIVLQNDLYEQVVQTIPRITIQTSPGIAFYVREFQDSKLERHIMGTSGLLDFYDDNTNIQGLYFIGPHLRPAINDNFVQDDEFIETNLTYDNFDEIKHPVKNGVYTIINRNSEADSSLLQNPNIYIPNENAQYDLYIPIYDNSSQPPIDELALIAQLAAPSQEENTLLLSKKIQNWLNNSSYVNNLSYRQKQIFIDLVYQAILKQYINSGNKYIYYQGGWFIFTNTNDVVVPSVQAIVDYYCTILRKRY